MVAFKKTEHQNRAWLKIKLDNLSYAIKHPGVNGALYFSNQKELANRLERILKEFRSHI